MKNVRIIMFGNAFFDYFYISKSIGSLSFYHFGLIKKTLQLKIPFS